MHTEMSSHTVTLSGWSWRESGKSEWTRCRHGNSTTEIYTDLLDAGSIPDPFKDTNEKEVQWASLKDWEYKSTFVIEQVDWNHDLVIEGLDTIADVYINEQLVLESRNMFHIHRIPHRFTERENEMRIVFKSALRYGHSLASTRGRLASASTGDDTRVYVRKAQYHYGWDWGPVLISCGPYKPVRVESYKKVGIKDVFVETTVPDDLARATLKVHVTLTAKDLDCEIKVEVNEPGIGSKKYFISAVSANGYAVAEVELEQPKLWFPRGHGEQPLYTIDVNINQETMTKKVGIRKVELVQHKFKTQSGSSFFFKVNNVSVFCAGSNWIPAHSFLSRLTANDYRKWINLAVDSNQNMIRVWGGGIYEIDEFYAYCDLKGILVWQDFMFACGQYPYFEEFRTSVKREIKDQLKRLRNFCSIIIYAGNNEDYQVAEWEKLEYDPKDHSGDWTNTNFPARTAYETDMPDLVTKYSPHTAYHPGSPFGGTPSGDPTIGDNHQWNVWHGTQEPYQDWAKLASRFVSEFGMLSYPDRSTINSFVSDTSELYPQSQTIESHCKAVGFVRRLALYVMENFKVQSMDLDSWIYTTQLMQSECLAYAYRCWRREWRGEGHEYVGGSLVWQLNDCWPVSSWSIIDHFMRKKLAYYAIKRECAEVMVGIYRTEQLAEASDIPPPADLVEKVYKFDVWGVNSTLGPVDGFLQVKIFDVATGSLVQDLGARAVTLGANQSTEILRNIDVSKDQAVRATFNFGESKVRTSDWPQPLKYLKMKDRNLDVVTRQGRVELEASRPVKGVRLSCTKDINWSDNGFDVFPGERLVIEAAGLSDEDDIRVEHYN